MLFSVLVPIYNAQEYLPRCLDSIMGQTWKDFELILVNDGSTDKSGEICEAYARKYPHTVRVIHQENKGALLTRRVAMRVAKGDFFLIPDADDYIYPHTLATVAEAIARYRCDLVLYDFHRVDLFTKETKIIRQLPIDTKSTDFIIDKNVLYRQICISNTAGMLNTKAFSRELVDWDVDYSRWGKKICVSNDLFQVFPIVTNAQKVVYIKEPLYCYVKTKGSITTKFIIEKYDSYMAIYRRREKYMDLWRISAQDRQNARIRTLNIISHFLLLAYQFSKETHDQQKFNWLIENIGQDQYFNEQYFKIKGEMSIKNRLILGNSLKKRKLLIKILLELLIMRKNVLFKEKKCRKRT